MAQHLDAVAISLWSIPFALLVLAPPGESDPSKEPEGFARRGVAVSLGAGVQACGRDWCDGYGFTAGARGQLELGYRFGIVEPLFHLGGGIGPAESSGDLRAAIGPGDGYSSVLDVGGGLMLFPVRRGRLDPFLGARIGYSHVNAKLNLSGVDVVVREVASRGGVTLTGGLAIYARPHFAVGPRFDVTLPFGGRLCARVTGGGESVEECYSVVRLDEDAGVDSSELPLPWSFTVDFRWVFGPPEN